MWLCGVKRLFWSRMHSELHKLPFAHPLFKAQKLKRHEERLACEIDGPFPGFFDQVSMLKCDNHGPEAGIHSPPAISLQIC